jgi:hypothetical protein
VTGGQIVTYFGPRGHGFYIFHALDPGTKSITVTADGYQEQTVQVTVPERQGDGEVVPVVKDVEIVPSPDSFPAIPGTYTVSGLVEHAVDAMPLGALVLANGKFSFTPFNAGPDSGRFSLNDVFLDSAGKITLFAFADGFSPYSEEFSPNVETRQLDTEIGMVRAPENVPRMIVDYTTEATSANRLTIRGFVRDERGTGLGALILANGKSQFTTFQVGEFELADVPLDANGRFTLFGFAFGFAPYKEPDVAP